MMMTKGRIVESEETAISRQWPSKHAPVTTDTHATMEELEEVVFSVWSMPKLYNKDNGAVSWSQRLSLAVSHKSAVRVGGWL